MTEYNVLVSMRIKADSADEAIELAEFHIGERLESGGEEGWINFKSYKINGAFYVYDPERPFVGGS